MTRKVTKHLPVPASLLLSSLLCLPLDAIATGNEDRHKQHTARNTTNNNAAQADDAVQARMRNRDRLLAQRQNAPTAVPSTPGQRQKHAVNQRAEREKIGNCWQCMPTGYPASITRPNTLKTHGGLPGGKHIHYVNRAPFIMW
ncbi:hypothetical protein ABC733_10730 [Mangrovibacter sp. SLW1]